MVSRLGAVDQVMLSEKPNGALVRRMSSGRIWRPIGGAERAVHSVRWQRRQVTPIGVAPSAPTGPVLGVDQPAGVLGGAAQRDGALDPGLAEAAAARGHRAGDREEALAIRQLQPLGDDLARRAEHLVHATRAGSRRRGGRTGSPRRPAAWRRCRPRSTRMKKNGTRSWPGFCSVVRRWAVCSKLAPNWRASASTS